MRGKPFTKCGQVSGFLRAMGHTPPPLDLMEYYMTLR
jgi:uncharacterized damage-inducible protein DinB